MKQMTLIWAAWILSVVGAINWGLVGLFNLNLVGMIFGDSLLARLIYILVGVGGGYLVYLMVQSRKPPLP